MTIITAEIFALKLENKWKVSSPSDFIGAEKQKTLNEAVRFVMESLSEAIVYAQGNLGPDGATKKEFVMTVLRRIYDTVIGPVLPYYLYPFSSLIKKLVVDVIISQAIDWAVSLYKNGTWNFSK